MVKYSPQGELIKSAAAAYKNWDNVPGMYAGLHKVGDVGKKMVTQAMENRRKLALKNEKENKEANKKKKKQDKAWYKIAGDVYEKAGSFLSNVEYNDTVAELKKIREDLVTVGETGNPEDRAAVMMRFNNIQAEVVGHKEFRDTLTDPEFGLSTAMDNSGVGGGDDGRDKEWITGFVSEKYTISRNKEGVKEYTFGGVSKTMEQIKSEYILKDNVPYAAYATQRTEEIEAKRFDRESTETTLRNNVVPKDINGLRAFLSDDGFNGKNFKTLLNDPKNKKAIMSEINSELFDTDDDPGISDTEYANFIEATVDPYHEIWKMGGETHDKQAWQENAATIATEQLANGIENGWNELNPPEEIVETNFDEIE